MNIRVVIEWLSSGIGTDSQPHLAHRKPIDVPLMSLFRSMLALIPQSGDFSGAALGVRSVALLQVPKPPGNLWQFLRNRLHI